MLRSEIANKPVIDTLSAIPVQSLKVVPYRVKYVFLGHGLHGFGGDFRVHVDAFMLQPFARATILIVRPVRADRILSLPKRWLLRRGVHRKLVVGENSEPLRTEAQRMNCVRENCLGCAGSAVFRESADQRIAPGIIGEPFSILAVSQGFGETQGLAVLTRHIKSPVPPHSCTRVPFGARSPAPSPSPPSNRRLRWQ